ncbi:MAG: lysoplasmalogenase [Sinobacteraceae bacterium]|nr:lysoplasmalogenase [Nevskiaceae bacterium]
MTIVGLAAVAVYFAAMLLEVPVLQWLTKPIPVLALALWVGSQAGSDRKWIAAGLGFSALGDLLLSLPLNAFLFGLLAFLVAHLLYLCAFVRRTRAPALGWAAAVATFGTVVFVTLQPYLGELRGAVLAYVIVICSMMWRALAQLGREEVAALAARWSALGAVIFAISDVLVARNRFVAASMTTQVALMILYWSAQWMLAASVSAASRPTLRPDRQ